MYPFEQISIVLLLFHSCMTSFAITNLNNTIQSTSTKSLDLCKIHTCSKQKAPAFCVECRITGTDFLNFSDVQTLSRTSVYNQTQLYVNISCENDGTLFIRQPYKAKNLISLRVHSCQIRHQMDYDFSRDLTDMPFTIRTLEFINSVEIQTTTELYDYYTDNANQILKFYRCDLDFPKTVRRFVMRNVEYVLEGSREFTKNEFFTEVGTKYKDFQKKRHRSCRSDMKYYEKSQINLYDPNDWVSQLLKYNAFQDIEVFNLTNIDLRKIPISFLGLNWNEDLPKLRTLDLSHNSITSLKIEPGPLDKFDSSFLVDLSYNNFTILDKDSISSMLKSYPASFSFIGNPLVCNCEQSQILDLIRVPKPRNESFAYLKCTSPKELAQRTLSELHTKDVCIEIPKQERDMTFVYIIIPVIVVASLITGVIILCRCRHARSQILSWTFSGEKMTPMLSSCKEFDAFISYSSLDEKWVFKLCKDIEDSLFEFRLCLHHRDFLPGACIADNIIENIEKSHHTIVVLSPNFLKSEWCILEFRKAFMQSLQEKNKRHLIVVLLEKIDPYNLSSDMKFFLHNYTYIYVNDDGFMDKLLKTLAKDKPKHMFTNV